MKKLYIIPFILIFSISQINAQRVIGYYPQWVQESFTPDRIDYDVITYVIHSFAWPDEEGNILHYDNTVSYTHLTLPTILLV